MITSSNYSLLNLPKEWDELMKPYLKTSGFHGLAAGLLGQKARSAVFNYNQAMLPLHLIKPQDVKVVILGLEPVNHNASPFLWVNNDGELKSAYRAILSKQYEGLRQQRYDKFKGTNYPMMRKNFNKDTWKNSETYWRVRSKKEAFLNYEGVENTPPFDTYNWFMQGVLPLNLNWTGSPDNLAHAETWRYFSKSLVFNLQKYFERIVFATASCTLHDYSALIATERTQGDHMLVFQEGLDNLFVNINESLRKLYNERLMINFILDGFNKEGNRFKNSLPEGPKFRTIGF